MKICLIRFEAIMQIYERNNKAEKEKEKEEIKIKKGPRGKGLAQQRIGARSPLTFYRIGTLLLLLPH
jgi:hypothetical protein